MSPDPCTDMHLLIQADIDGELDAAEAARVAVHLAACPDCARLQARLLALSGRMREVPRYTAPESLRRAIHDKVAQPRPSAWERLARGRRGPAAGALGFALAACLAVVAVLPRGETVPDWLVAAHIRALQPDHLMDVASSERHTVKPWFAGRIPFSPPVKDLAAQGFPLAGARLDTLPGQTAATLVYRRRKHIIDLFVWPAGRGGGGNGTLTREGYNIVRWEAEGMIFAAVSDLNAKELDEFATLWRQAS